MQLSRHLLLLTLLAPAGAQLPQLEVLSRQQFPGSVARAVGCAVGDLNGDGAPDIAVASYNSSPSQLFFNDGTGRFRDESGRIPVTWAMGVAAGDVDGDGDVDLVFADRANLRLVQFRNGGAGTFTAVPMPALTVNHLSLADVDGDGDLDLLGIGKGNANRLLLNDGRGGFTLAVNHLPPGNQGDLDEQAVLFDLDKDGDLDIAIASSHQNLPQKVWINDGTGRYSSSSAIPQALFVAKAVVAGDFDKDGDIDLYFGTVAQTTGGCQPDQLWLNDGRGRFIDVSATHVTTNAFCAYWAQAGDIDGDGDLDLAVAHGWDQRNQVYLNDGTGRFTASTRIDATNTATFAAALADFDRDGDLDYFAGNWGGANDLYYNLHRQTHSASRPRIGTTYSLDVYGRPGYATGVQTVISALQIQRAQPAVVIPGIEGWFGLGTPVVGLAVQRLPAPGGRVSLPIPIPNLQALKGQPFYVQAIVDGVGVGPGFTNVWADAIER